MLDPSLIKLCSDPFILVLDPLQWKFGIWHPSHGAWFLFIERMESDPPVMGHDSLLSKFWIWPPSLDAWPFLMKVVLIWCSLKRFYPLLLMHWPLKHYRHNPPLDGAWTPHFDMKSEIKAYSRNVLFLTEEAWSYRGLWTRELGQTPSHVSMGD